MPWDEFEAWANDQIDDIPPTLVSHPAARTPLFRHMIGNAPVEEGPPSITLADGRKITP